MSTISKTAIALLLLYISIASAVQTIKVQGADFVSTVTNSRLQIIGVAYQPGGSSGFNPGSGVDPLSNGTICLRDAALMQQLGVNTIRVYNLDPAINHDMCASLFNAVGIYMLLDVNSPLPGQSLNRADPGSTYNSDYLTQIFGIVEAFKNYPNTLGFFAGNEVINDDPSGAVVPPYLRAVTRDLKNYISKHSTRSIPVGYSAADVSDILADTWEYLQCAINGSTSDMSRSDFFGLNSYTWCGNVTYDSSGYDTIVSQFANTTIPIFFSEYGCNRVLPRVFSEVPVLYGLQMTSVMSGGLVYEYSQEVSNYGLIVLYSNGTAQLRGDYDSLQAQYNKLNITLLESRNSTATALTPPTCKSSLITANGFYNKFDIPSVPSGGQQLINNGISNPNNGKLVTITQDTVPATVYASNGGVIQNLAIKPLPEDQSNTPNGEDTSGSAATSSSTTASAAKPTTTKKGAGSRKSIGILGMMGPMALLLIFCIEGRSRV
ncbi:MAG: glycoside hydrolase family 72 [Lasallia pustulata]|uniref:1,3-beta-glucanosyltransferase n=1 Tax=Lasallia pustulata TaxID=136370 RepID=A0A5M8PFN5_9LECA|nr:MAG: glycoside hydrolase family 72 [Lasallia pustulata]